MNYKAVLFDLDGTLLDYKTAQRNATNNRQNHYKLVNSPEVQSYESRGIPSPESPEMQKAFRTHNINSDPEVFLKNYFAKLSQHGIPMPGAEELLKRLIGKTKLAVVSNGPGEVQNPRLEKAGLSGFFPDRFYSRDLGIAKPDPAILQLAIKKLNTTEKETLFIGDSRTSDQPAAEAAKINFFLFEGNFEDPKLLAMLF